MKLVRKKKKCLGCFCCFLPRKFTSQSHCRLRTLSSFFLEANVRRVEGLTGKSAICICLEMYVGAPNSNSGLVLTYLLSKAPISPALRQIKLRCLHHNLTTNGITSDREGKVINISYNTQHSESNEVEEAGAGRNRCPEEGFVACLMETRIHPPLKRNNYSGRKAGIQGAMKTHSFLSSNVCLIQSALPFFLLHTDAKTQQTGISPQRATCYL